LHYQVGKFSEGKLITCVQGSIFDIAVDIKSLKNKKCKIHTEILSDKNKKIIYIPKGVAHGFQTLKKNTIVLYFHSNYYTANHQKTIGIKSKFLNIKLPKKITIISKKDNFQNEMQKL
jgi:dTDP-4-dehydrorhamnose 3,5-epimerase